MSQVTVIVERVAKVSKVDKITQNTKNRENDTQVVEAEPIYKEPTERQKLFVDTLIANPKLSQTQAYMQVFPTNKPESAAVQASNLLKKNNVAIYKQSVVNSARRSIAELSKSARSEDVRLRSSQDILDRTHGKAKTTVDITSKVVTVSLDLSGTTPQLQPE